MGKQLLLFTAVLVLSSIPSSSAAAAAADDILTAGKALADGHTLVSAGSSFVLGFFSPTNSSNRYVGIWYGNVTAFTVVWVANRQSPITPQSTGILKLTSAGSLLLLSNQSSILLWSSTAATANAPSGGFVAQLLESGNFVVRQNDGNFSGKFIWQSFDHPTDNLLPGMKLGTDLRSGLTRNLTSWATQSDPSPGKYTIAIDLRGVPQFVMTSGSVWIWRAGPWNGADVVGAPTTANYHTVTYVSNYSANQDEVFYSFNPLHGLVIRFLIGNDGKIRVLVWFDPPGSWRNFYSGPSDACDRLSFCGAYSVCDLTNSGASSCSCMPGFEYNSGVCLRTKALECGGGDGFAVVNRVKLPDTSAAVLEGDLDLEGCRERCLGNCDCTAYARANVTEGGRGCFMWASELTDTRVMVNAGEYLYVRLAADTGKKNKSWIFIIVAATAILLIITLFICFIKLRRAGRAGNSDSEQPALRWNSELTNKFEVSRETSSDFFLFQFSQIVEATDNFAPSNKLGEGGFGPVYKGRLLDGQYIAVKRLSTGSGQGLDEFKNEISLIAKLQHRNLVRLLGCCFEGEEKMLVYEYMSNKSLDLFLFDPNQKAKLDWARRFQIIEGIAQGLLYLHKHSRLTIIHRDLKASNILLDDDFKPKISDFGMARIFSLNESESNTTNKVVGTYGYISPEYAMKGHFSTKSDVFSFGVLMLEIITGNRNSGFHQRGSSLNLLAYAWELWKERSWVELVDNSLGGMYPLEELSRCVHVALLCVQERAVDRPSTSDLLTMLISDNAHLSYPNQPAFFLVEMPSRVHGSPISINKSQSLNEFTITGIDGR